MTNLMRTSVDEMKTYYALTGKEYLMLSGRENANMNLGIWPADNIHHAQDNLVELIAKKVNQAVLQLDNDVNVIVEGGSGWGGARKFIDKYMKNIKYYGLNISEEQILFSKRLNKNFPNTKYIHCPMEDLANILPYDSSVFFGIESVIHVQDKKRLFQNAANAGIKAIILAEILTKDKKIIAEEKLFNPSLSYIDSFDHYADSLNQAGFSKVYEEDITDQVFNGWFNALKCINIEKHSGRKRILKQFIESYEKLNLLSLEGTVQYKLITALAGD